MDVLAEEQRLTSILGSWAAVSVGAGAGLWALGGATGRRSLTGFGRQTVLWGAVDGAIAAAGIVNSRRRSGSPTADELEAHRARVRRVLAINAAADVAYLALGAAVLSRSRQGRSAWRMNSGDGAAIIVQGGFLLVLDTAFAWRLRP